MSRCTTRSLWVGGLHVDTRRFPVTLADGTPVRLTADGPGVHVRALPGPVDVLVVTPAGTFTATVDPATCFGARPVTVAGPVTAAAVTVAAAGVAAPGAAGRAAAATLEAADPHVLAAAAVAAPDVFEATARHDPTAGWVLHAAAAALPADGCPVLATVAAVVFGDGRVDGVPVAAFAGRLAPDVRLGVLAAIAPHVSRPLTEELIVRELTVWNLPERSAVLTAALAGTDTDVIFRIFESCGLHDQPEVAVEALPLAAAAEARLEVLWAEHAATLPVEERRAVFTKAPTDDTVVWTLNRWLRARGAVATFTVDDVAWAASDPAGVSAFTVLLGAPSKVDAEAAAVLGRLRPDRDTDPVRWALLTARFAADRDEVTAAAALLGGRADDDRAWIVGKHPAESFAAAVLANSSLTDDDRRRLLPVERRCFAASDRSRSARSLTVQLAGRHDPDAVYQLLRSAHRPPAAERWFVDAVAAAAPSWPGPQLAAAARTVPVLLLTAAQATPPLRDRLVQLTTAGTETLPELLRGFAATDRDTARSLLEQLAARTPDDPAHGDGGVRARSTNRAFWEAADGLLRNPGLSPAEKATLLGSELAASACPQIAVAALAGGRPLTKALERLAEDWQAGDFRAVRRGPFLGTAAGVDTAPVLWWLTAFGVAHPDRDLVDTVWSLAGAWNGTVADLLATARALG